jgi:hypothetical protein
MHPRVLIERGANAQARILSAAKIIAQQYHLAALDAATDRDPQVAALKQREAIADLLEALQIKLTEKPVEQIAPIPNANVNDASQDESTPPPQETPAADDASIVSAPHTQRKRGK